MGHASDALSRSILEVQGNEDRRGDLHKPPTALQTHINLDLTEKIDTTASIPPASSHILYILMCTCWFVYMCEAFSLAALVRTILTDVDTVVIGPLKLRWWEHTLHKPWSDSCLWNMKDTWMFPAKYVLAYWINSFSSNSLHKSK